MKTLILLLVLFICGWLLLRRSLPCPSYLSKMVEMDNPFAKACSASSVLNSLGNLDDKTVADIGCGPGRIILKASQIAKKVIAVDIQQEMLDKLIKKSSGNNIETLCLDISKKCLPSNSVDIVIMSAVLGETPDKKAALENIYTSLKPGGILSISELIFDPHFQREGQVLKLATKIGFEKAGFHGKSWAYTLHLKKPLEPDGM